MLRNNNDLERVKETLLSASDLLIDIEHVFDFLFKLLL